MNRFFLAIGQNDFSMNIKKVAIILVNWNGFEYTNDCIASLQHVKNVDFDIILVDNGSTDHSGKQLKQRYPSIILIEAGQNLGFTGGNNLGLQYSLNNGYTYSMMLNNDTTVESNFLEELVNYMDQHPQIGAIQPKIMFQYKRTHLWDGGSYYNKFLGHTYTSGYNKTPAPCHNRIKKVDWITGCGFLTRNSVLNRTGLLPTNFFIYYEDVDLSFRIKKLGYNLIYYPHAVIYHVASVTHRQQQKGKEGYRSPIVYYWNLRNRIWVLKQYTPWYFAPSVAIFNFFYTTAFMLYFVARFRFQKFKAVCQAVKDGILESIKYN